jgi:hypothetical protein
VAGVVVAAGVLADVPDCCVHPVATSRRTRAKNVIAMMPVRFMPDILRRRYKKIPKMDINFLFLSLFTAENVTFGSILSHICPLGRTMRDLDIGQNGKFFHKLTLLYP